MKKKVIESYYDGHYIDSGLPIEERERLLKEELEKSEKITEWPKDTQTKVVRKGKIIKVTDSK